MKLYITGDTHGSVERFLPDRWKEKGFPPLTREDYILVLGDFGIPWECLPLWEDASGNVHEAESDAEKLDYLADVPATFLFIDGNHENFDLLNAYPVEEWNGGKVHRLRSNVLHLMRGEVFRLRGMKFFAFGGGKSIDRMLRMEGMSWWPQELPSEKEFARAKENLAKAGNQVDLVFSHAAPLRFLHPHRNLLGFDPSLSEDNAVKMLSKLEPSIRYRRWYFGHYHIDFFDKERNARWMYRNIDWVEW